MKKYAVPQKVIEVTNKIPSKKKKQQMQVK